MQKTLSVVIPSRARERQLFFLEQAVASVRRQSAICDFKVDFFVAVDSGVALSKLVCEKLKIICIESQGRSQASALNSAIRRVDSQYVAFLEDDDQWRPEFLGAALNAMEEARADFVSSTQSEYDELGNYLRINDFPTPSGWFMKTAILHEVGEFNEAFRFHLDNEWLGRLHDKGAKRVHLVEATAPLDFHYAQFVRPWLANLVGGSNQSCSLHRHASPFPLVDRLVHPESNMVQIGVDSDKAKLSKYEYRLLMKRFKRIPI